MAQTIAWSQQTLPDRILPSGQDLGVSTRPVGLNPDGINFNDCYTDQTLRFYLIASGFTSGQNLGVYATVTGSCSSQTELATPADIDCWYLGTTLQSIPATESTPVTINVRVQDLVAYQDVSIPQVTSYTPQGVSACSSQTTTSGSTITVVFVPLNGGLQPTGTALSYAIPVDLVGPAPPADVRIGDGDTLFVVNWTQNADTATQGYDVFVHALGSADAGYGSHSIVADIDAENTCDEDAAAVSTGDDSSTALLATVTVSDAANDAEFSDAEPVEASPGDATVADASMQDATTDAKTSGGGGHACVVMTSAGNTGSTMCINNTVSDPVLSVVLNQFNSDTSSNVIENEAGAVVAEEGGVIQGGGNSGVNVQYLQNASAGETVSGESTGSYTVTGLTNGNYYAVAVSAVDAFGNIGPPSTPQACDYPAPVNDFWTVYREDGGPSGGLCALEAVGAPATSTAAFASLGAAGIALLRRRRSRKRL
jgi:hypothetical protein